MRNVKTYTVCVAASDDFFEVFDICLRIIAGVDLMVFAAKALETTFENARLEALRVEIVTLSIFFYY